MRKNGGIVFPGKSCAIQFMKKNEVFGKKIIRSE